MWVRFHWKTELLENSWLFIVTRVHALLYIFLYICVSWILYQLIFACICSLSLDCATALHCVLFRKSGKILSTIAWKFCHIMKKLLMSWPHGLDLVLNSKNWSFIQWQYQMQNIFSTCVIWRNCIKSSLSPASSCFITPIAKPTTWLICW